MRGENWHMAIFILIHFSLYCCDFLISWCRHPPSNLSHPPNPEVMSTKFLVTLELESEQPISHFKRFSGLPVVFGPREDNCCYVTVAWCYRAGQRAPWDEGSRTLAAERRGMEECQWADSWEKLQEETAESIHGGWWAWAGGREGPAPGKCNTQPPREPQPSPWVHPLGKWTKCQLLQLSEGLGLWKYSSGFLKCNYFHVLNIFLFWSDFC